MLIKKEQTKKKKKKRGTCQAGPKLEKERKVKKLA